MEQRVQDLESVVANLSERFGSIEKLAVQVALLKKFIQIQFDPSFEEFCMGNDYPDHETKTNEGGDKDKYDDDGDEVEDNWSISPKPAVVKHVHEAYQSDEQEDYYETEGSSGDDEESLDFTAGYGGQKGLSESHKVISGNQTNLSLRNGSSQRECEAESSLKLYNRSINRGPLIHPTKIKNSSSPKSTIGLNGPPPLLHKPPSRFFQAARQTSSTLQSQVALIVGGVRTTRNNRILKNATKKQLIKDIESIEKEDRPGTGAGKYSKYYRKIDQSTIQCLICKKHLRRRCKFIQHLRTHTGEKPYVCEFCQASFSRKDNMTLHKNRHHDSQQLASFNDNPQEDSSPSPGQRLSMACQGCDASFTSETELISHYQSDHNLQGCDLEEFFSAEAAMDHDDNYSNSTKRDGGEVYFDDKYLSISMDDEEVGDMNPMGDHRQ